VEKRARLERGRIVRIEASDMVMIERLRDGLRRRGARVQVMARLRLRRVKDGADPACGPLPFRERTSAPLKKPSAVQDVRRPHSPQAISQSLPFHPPPARTTGDDTQPLRADSPTRFVSLAGSPSRALLLRADFRSQGLVYLRFWADLFGWQAGNRGRVWDGGGRAS
jgi:hypothetical protein